MAPKKVPSGEYCKIFKKQLFLRKPPMAAYLPTRNRKEEESMGKFFQMKKEKWKPFIYLLPASFGASYIRNANTTTSILKFNVSLLLSLQILFLSITADKLTSVAFISSFNQKQVEAWLKGPNCNFTKQLYFLHSCKWLFPIIYLI